jgi:integrase
MTNTTRLNTRQAAEYLGIPEPTLRWFRHKGDRGPRSYALTKRHVVYDLADLQAWAHRIPRMSTKRNPSTLGYIEDRWFDDDDQPKARNGQGKRYRARWVDDDGKERAASFASEKAAKGHLRQVARGEYANTTGKLTFGAFFKEWSENQVWAPGTVRKVAQAIDSVTFADVQLDHLRPSHIQAWIKVLADKLLAPNTIQSRFDHIRAAVRAAVADRAIPFDVTATVKLPARRRAEAAMTVPTTAQVGDVLHFAPDTFQAFVAVCAFGGLRLGEAAALKVSDIDFMRREVNVERQAQVVNGGGVDIRPPKFGSERTVYIPQDLVTILSEHVRVHIPGDDPDRWMFPGHGDDPLHQNSAGHLWRGTRGKAGVSFKLHDLRHFYASGLIAAGCDVVTVQRAMGHGSASLTLNTYSHLWPKAEDRTRNAAAQMLTEALTADRVRTTAQ